MGESPNDYQMQFFRASQGRDPETESELSFAALTLPVSPEDAAWRHIKYSAEYARQVVDAVGRGDLSEARVQLQSFRDEGMQTRGFGKEALAKLQACGLIGDLYTGDLIVPDSDILAGACSALEKLIATPRPM